VPGEPVVARIYYMRYAGAPHDALIVGGTREPIYCWADSMVTTQAS
jgi:hypothetical protein